MEKRSTATETGRRAGSELGPFLFLTLALFAFWLVLSGKYEAKYITIGFFAALGAAAVSMPLLRVPVSSKEDSPLRSAYDLPWLRLLGYFPWLVWQIVLANIDVAKIILNPRLPIQPQLVRFHKDLPGPVAHLTLANSITLTPGTITIEMEGGNYLVHAISDSAAESLAPKEGKGEMPQKVGLVFGEQD
ncbi:MAG: Na+/H+ antiporter subunit E [Clostridia bacterium]|nr:Na+/H+ antiporter subunit E [Clostridia bacterium]